jgi:hypothetical protein
MVLEQLKIVDRYQCQTTSNYKARKKKAKNADVENIFGTKYHNE